MKKCDEVQVKLLEYIAHTLNEEDNSKVEEHLAQCAECRGKLQDILDSSDTYVSKETRPKKAEPAPSDSNEDTAGAEKVSPDKGAVSPERVKPPSTKEGDKDIIGQQEGEPEKPAGFKKPESEQKGEKREDKEPKKEKKKAPVLSILFLIVFLILIILAFIKVTSIYTDMAEQSQVKASLLPERQQSRYELDYL